MAKNTSVEFNGVHINIVDTPGHADFGGEVERTLSMVDGVMLLVDASEGPLPQTRFVLGKALEKKLHADPGHQQDRPPRRAHEGGARRGLRPVHRPRRRRGPAGLPGLLLQRAQGDLPHQRSTGEDQLLMPLLEAIVKTVPAPRYDPALPLQLLVANIDYDDYIGRLIVGRIFNGSIRKDQQAALCRLGGEIVTAKITGLFGQTGLQAGRRSPRRGRATSSRSPASPTCTSARRSRPPRRRSRCRRSRSTSRRSPSSSP